MAPPTTRTRLYCTARAVFVSAQEQLPEFDRVFAAIFEGFVDPADARGDPNALTAPRSGGAERRAAPSAAAAPRSSVRRRPAGRRADGEIGRRGRPRARGAARRRERRRAPRRARLRRARCGRVARVERAHAQALARAAAPARPAAAPPTAGRRLDVRATLRASHRTGGDPSRRIMRRRVQRPRRIVVLSRHLRLDGAVHPRVPAVSARVRRGRERRGVRVRDPPDTAHPRAQGPPARPRDRTGRRGGEGLVRWHPDRRGPAALQRRARAARDGPRRGRRHPLGRVGARRSRPASAARCAGFDFSPTGSSGSTRGRRAASTRPWQAAWPRRCPRATSSSAATTCVRSKP